MLKVKRVYETAETEDGYRVLVDRIWPRGVSKEKAAIDIWLKEVAPSSELRKWFNHDPAKYSEFTRRYLQELTDENHQKVFDQLKQLVIDQEDLTLVYGAKDSKHNQALVLKEKLERESR